jgi:hypothetical protein
MKMVQDFEDEDLELDVTKSKKVKAAQQENKGERKPTKEEDKKDTRNLLYVIGVVVLIVVIFIAVFVLYKPGPQVVTIDDLHAANLAGELPPEVGYLYNGFSFIKYENLWYSQLARNTTVYDVSFNYDPKSVEDIPVEGKLVRDFVKDKRIYITFDPTGDYLSYVGVANFGLSRSLAWAFGYNMTAGCTKNVTSACQKAGVVLCGDPDKAVIYFKETNETKVILDDTCVTVQGMGPEIVRAKDRLLLRWYGMMD